MNNKKYTLYMHTNKINNKKYIGITSDNPLRRWRKDGSGYKNGLFSKAINKYGWDNFSHEILFTDLTEEEALNKEKELISRYNTTNSMFGYNITDGGDLSSGYMFNAKRVYQYSLSGKYITSFDSIAEAERIYGKGIHSCINNRSKTSNGYQWFDEFMGENTNSKMSREEAISFSQYKAVYQYSLDGNFIAKYNSIKEASEKNKYERSGISSCIIGRQKTCHNFRWFDRFVGMKIEPLTQYNHNAKEIYQYSLDGRFIQKYNSIAQANKYIGKNIYMNKKMTNKSCGYIWSFEPIGDDYILQEVG